MHPAFVLESQVRDAIGRNFKPWAYDVTSCGQRETVWVVAHFQGHVKIFRDILKRAGFADQVKVVFIK